MNLADLGRNKCGESREVRGQKAQFRISSLLVGTFFWPCPVSNECSLLYLHIKLHSNSLLGEGLSAQCLWRGLSASNWSQDCIRGPGCLWCQQRERPE